MQIKDVCRQCGLTKKAVEYYERQGLVRPEIGENGYRLYGESDIASLKEIALLRRLGIGVADIKKIVASPDKSAALDKCFRKMQADIHRRNAQYESLQYLLSSGYDVEKAAKYTEKALDEYAAMKERLLSAFPGGYGQYLYIHFGPFLDGPIDSREKEEAYQAILDFLDEVQSMEISPELESYMEQVFDTLKQEDMAHIHASCMDAITDINAYMAQNKDSLKAYLQYRQSEAFQNSPAGKMKEMLLAFQQSAGYYDVFIPNLKALSPSYCEYVDRIEKANAVFLDRYPE